MLALVAFVQAHVTAQRSSRRGVSMLEYVLIAAAILVVLAVFRTQIGDNLSALVSRIGTTIKSA